jgi:hypothetical protein
VDESSSPRDIEEKKGEGSELYLEPSGDYSWIRDLPPELIR